MGGIGPVCGKRLKALLPLLIESMERNGHLSLAPEIRAKLLAVSATGARQDPTGGWAQAPPAGGERIATEHPGTDVRRLKDPAPV
jgi:hypothetical protein